MALRAGERLGPYEILGGLGAGGMGEVYRARDTRVGRSVAVEVLPVTREGVLPDAISPDGSLVAARDSENRLLLCPAPGGDPRSVPGTPETGSITAWSADGRALFVTEVEGVVGKAYRRDLVTGRRDLVKEIRPPDPVGLTLFAFLMAADGRSYAYQYYRDLSALFLVEGLK